MEGLTISKKELKLLDQVAQSLFTRPSDAEALLAHFSEKNAAALPPELQVNYWRMRGFFENLHHRLETAGVFYEKALASCNHLLNPLPSRTRILIDRAGVQINQRAWAEAEKTLQITEQNSQRLGDDPKLEARIACRLGFLNLHYGRFERAALYFLHSERNFKENGGELSLEDAYFLALVSSGLGDLYGKINDPQKSVEAFQRTLDIYESYGLRINLIWHYLNTGRSYLTLSQLDKAVYYFKKAAEQPSEGAAANRAKGSACANIAIVFIQQHNFGAATEWLNQAQNLIGTPEQEEDFTNLSKIETQRARIFVHLHEPNLAALHFDKAEYLAYKGDSLHNLQNICHVKADFHAEQGAFQKAYRYRTLGSELALRHTEQVREEQIREIRIKYDAEQREQESHLARLQLTGLHLKALRVQMNPHFIFNALNAIQSFINSDRREDAAIWLARFAKLMRKALDLSDLEQVELDDEVSFLNQYLELNKKLRFRDAFTYQVVVEKTVQELYPEIPAMVVQPFVENAIEHGLRPQKGGHLEVRFSYLDEISIRCTVTDDGVGLYAKQLADRSDKHRSKGVSITKERLALLFADRGRKGVFVHIQDREELTSGLEKGVLAEVILPVL